MSRERFKKLLEEEVARIDAAGTAKRVERLIEVFDERGRAVIEGKPYTLFNSNDYLGLRHHERLRAAEEEASRVYGTGPGAVRFISGALGIYRELEEALARFHGREDAVLFSSAFAANLGVIHALLAGQSKDSLVTADTLVISDALNHRSIIDGIRVAGLASEQRLIFEHGNVADLARLLGERAGKFSRALIITDGVFSMLGEYADLGALADACAARDDAYEYGVALLVDDAHGVGCFGATGRGTEEVTGARCDVLVGTLGKAFGTDGGYVVADRAVTDYLREAAATYIYSNSISPGTAGAALEAVRLVGSKEGGALLAKLRENVALFTEAARGAGLTLAATSTHAIQPILIGDPQRTKALARSLFAEGMLVTPISYPVVPEGRDELRVQLSAMHTREDITRFIDVLAALLGAS